VKKKNSSTPLANLGFAFFIMLTIIFFPSFFGKLDAWLHDNWLQGRLYLNRPTLSKSPVVSFFKKFAPAKPISNEITLVLLDDHSMLNLPGLYDGDRRYFAHAVETLAQHNPKVIALDVFFGTKSFDNQGSDQALVEAVKNKDNVVIKAYRRDDLRITPPYPKLALSTTYAPSYFKQYRDKSIRSVSMVFNNEKNELIPSFQSEIMRLYHGLNKNDVKYDQNFMYVRKPSGIEKIPLVDREYMLLNYDSVIKSYRTVSFYDLYMGRVPKEVIENKIIIVGEAHSMLQENFYTPLGQNTHSPYLNALAVRNLINGNYLTQLDEITALIIPIVILAVFIFFIFNFLNPVLSLGLTLVTCPILAIISFLCLTLNSEILDMSASIIAVSTSLIFVIGRKYYIELAEKSRIKYAFQHYVTASVVNEILKDPEKLNLHGEERELTIFFSDIEGFTSMAEGMSPLEVVALLNEYLTEMTEIIFEYEGLLDKYEGDAIMAIFGAPINQEDHAIRACRCALVNQKALSNLREKWKAENKPQLKARIGINTGNVVVGNMGSKMRFDYTVIGDNVNLASRLEIANKIFNTEILISEKTAELASSKIVSRCIAAFQAVGRSKIINVYEVLADVENPDKEHVKQAIHAKTVYENALAQIIERKFTEAEQVLAEYVKENPKDLPAQALYSKAKSFTVVPPPMGKEILVIQDIK
jgi:class 3 adenylate cyclase/CHASE2 domain-containing sensor protein